MIFRSKIVAAAVTLAVLWHSAGAAAPAWWVNFSSGNPAHDYAPVTLGQLKWVATNAADELNAHLANGAQSTVMNMVNAWSTVQPGGSRVPIVTANTHDYAIANLGQLKSTAKPFWDRLIAEHRALTYPWTATTSDDDDFAPANLGQLKALFAFDAANPDQDGDGVADVYEVTVLNTDPLKQDTDGDGSLDGVDAFPTDPAHTLPALQITLLGPL